MISLEALNALPAGEFVTALGAVFEHSPWVAQGAFAHRPFRSRLHLLDAMRDVVQQAGDAQQLALIRAHPRLGAGRRARVVLTDASAREQQRAGLDACSAQQLALLEQLNDAYAQRFGFPFVLAVRGHDPSSIIARFQQRLAQEPRLEQRTALAEIGLIAGYRLADLVSSPPGLEALAMLERSGADPAPLREWMLAAGLEMFHEDDGGVLGLARRSGDDKQMLLLGVHYDPQAGTVRYDPPSGVIIAIATLQWLRQQGSAPSSTVAILAQPTPAGDARTQALRALRAAALETQGCIVRCESHAASGSQRQRLDAPAAERAARALRAFVMQTTPLDTTFLHQSDFKP